MCTYYNSPVPPHVGGHELLPSSLPLALRAMPTCHAHACTASLLGIPRRLAVLSALADPNTTSSSREAAGGAAGSSSTAATALAAAAPLPAHNDSVRDGGSRAIG